MIDIECGHATPMDPDKTFGAISNSRRRRIILSFARTDKAMAASDLNIESAAVENVVVPSEATDNQWTRVSVSLIQAHLETLDKVDFADCGERSKQAVPTDATKPLARYIRIQSTGATA